MPPQEERGEKRKSAGVKDKVWASASASLEEQSLEVLESSRHGEESAKMLGTGICLESLISYWNTRVSPLTFITPA